MDGHEIITGLPRYFHGINVIFFATSRQTVQNLKRFWSFAEDSYSGKNLGFDLSTCLFCFVFLFFVVVFLLAFLVLL